MDSHAAPRMSASAAGPPATDAGEAAITERWTAAQQYERGYWASVAERIASGDAPQLEWYQWRAEQLTERLRGLGLAHVADGRARVLEVGSGPVGLVTFFPGRDRIAVDPLHDFYGQDRVLSALRNPAVAYRQGLGEAVPCETGSCDLVVIENCIDHVQNVAGVMSELVRVLRPGGVLYLTVNSRTRGGYYVHRLLSRLQIDRGHPHTFTPSRAAALIERYGFEIVQSEAGSAVAAHVEDLRNPRAQKRLKAMIGVSEFLLTYVAVKPVGPAH
jgi:SAM-dependent methyltransferase